MVTTIFAAVQQFLEWIAKKTHRTYNEINIIVYYFIIPLTWTLMIDYVFSLPLIISIAYSLFCIIVVVRCKSFKKFSDWLFVKSADFIEYFGDYFLFSVVICVLIPLLIYIGLIFMSFQHFKGVF